MMKKLIVIILFILVFFSILAVSARADIYAQTFVIVETDTLHDVITMIDFVGNKWEWNGVEDWICGDLVSALMDDNNTEIIYDDIILNIRYSGWIEID